jgi:tight adherence protein B
MDVSKLAIIVLAMVAAGAIAYVFIYPYLSGEARGEKRQQALTKPASTRAADRLAAATTNRRDSVAQSLKDIEAREKARNKLTLENKIAQAGLDWDRRKFYLVSGIIGMVVGVGLYFSTANLIVAGVGLFVGALGLPQWLLGYLRNKRIKRFVDEFPNAMDVIVRGVKSGLPLGDCLRIIANEAAEPVKSEFRHIVEQQALGIPVGDACSKLFQRVPVAEANFFGIVIAIQQKAGGSLSEALANLSKVLRERKKMKGKIVAMSMEAKASAAIIASLPFVVGILVYLSSPRYIELLWIKEAGKITLAISAFWMFIGVMAMKKMISFDF